MPDERVRSTPIGVGQNDEPRQPGRPEDDTGYSRIAGRWVRRAWREPPARPVTPARALVGAVEHRLRVYRRRRTIVRASAVAATAAMGIAAVVTLMWTHPPRPAPTTAVAVDLHVLMQLPPAGGRSDSPETAVRPGTRLAPAAGATSMRLGSLDGTELSVTPGSELRVVEVGPTRRFALGRGSVNVHVAKLTTGERFLIDTPDATIEVHGTTFRVAIANDEAPCAQGTKTRVSVAEGVVAVKGSGREDRLAPGEEWPRSCATTLSRVGDDDARMAARMAEASPAALERAGAPERSRPRSRRLSKAKGTASRTTPADATPSASLLEAQNDLFASAVRAKRHGEVARALTLFERFIDTYPDAALLESALAQQMRLLAGRDPARAVAIATRYLARFPDGFARGEARSLVDQGAHAP